MELPHFPKMNLVFRISTMGCLGLLIISCNREEGEVSDRHDSAGEISPEISSRTVMEPDGGSAKRVGGTRASESFSKLRGMTDKAAKRDFFAEVLLELPPEDHEYAVEAVAEDLNSAAPANLVTEYLELSSLMSPALQLPGMVRLLEERALPQLQRVAMVQQLREDLGVPVGQRVQSWRPWVEKHLRENPRLIAE